MNIFQIKQDLLSIFDEIEENGGELTEELASQLEITQESFRSKCESYANVIKSVKADIAAIDQESKRLATLKKTKANLIERLNGIMIDAINTFGDISKSGTRFIDYGTGKISIRNTVKCETDDDKLKCMGEEYAKCLAFENMLGNASNRENITAEELIQRCKEHKVENLDVVADDPYDITREDIETAIFDVSIKVVMEDMCSSNGYQAIKKLAKEFGTNISIEPKVDKTQLKSYLSKNEDNNVTIGKLIPNQTLTIK